MMMTAEDDDIEKLFVFPEKPRLGNPFHKDMNPPLAHYKPREKAQSNEHWCGKCGKLIPEDGRRNPRVCKTCLKQKTPPSPGERYNGHSKLYASERLFQEDPKGVFSILMEQASRAGNSATLNTIRQRIKHFLAELEGRVK